MMQNDPLHLPVVSSGVVIIVSVNEWFPYSRDVDERRVAPVDEGAVEDLQSEGQVLQREERDGGAHREQEALQGGEEQGQRGGVQVGLLRGFSCGRKNRK